MAGTAQATLVVHWAARAREEIKLRYNPTELSFDKGVQIAEIAVPGLNAPLQQFVRGQAEKLSVELFFDTTDFGMGSGAKSVAEETDRIYALARMEPSRHAPPVVTFFWGLSVPGRNLPEASGNQRREGFKGVVEAVKTRFTLFSPEGVPLRAAVTLTIREYAPLDEQLPRANKSSPDKTHAHVLKEGETLSHVAAVYFLRAQNWRPIAEANDVDDPRRMTVGRMLRVPAIAAGGEGAMTFQALAELSKEPAYQGFYVPHYEIRIAGEAADRSVIHDVSQITYKDNVREIDSVDITVNNWDDKADRLGVGRFKYFGAETDRDLADESSLARLFEPGNRQVEVWLGYLGALRLVSTVTFQSVEPNFPSSGGPTLQVRGLNVLHRLRKAQHSRPWYKARPSDIARDVGARSGEGGKGPKIAIEIDDAARAAETPIDFIAQDNDYDIDFLLNLARRVGYELTVVSNEPPKLRFGPSARATAQTNYRLVWGESLIDFKPRLTTARQVGKVTVQGWDRKTKKPIKVTVDTKDKEVKRINADLHRLVDGDLAREELKVDEPVGSEQEARQRARALMLDQMKQMVTAEGSTVGLPELRAGSRLEIDGVGARMNGEYFVTETTHTFSDSGYVTRFKANRESGGPGR